MYFEERKESYGFHAREFGLIYCILQIKRKKYQNFATDIFFLNYKVSFHLFYFFVKCFKSLVF